MTMHEVPMFEAPAEPPKRKPQQICGNQGPWTAWQEWYYRDYRNCLKRHPYCNHRPGHESPCRQYDTKARIRAEWHS